jgi:serine protease inhibitor
MIKTLHFMIDLAGTVGYNISRNKGESTMKTYYPFFILSTFLFFCTCSKDYSPIEADNPAPIRDLTANEKAVVQSSADFGLELFQAIENSAKEEDVFISPLSVSMALGMTLNGAGGSTWQAISQTLHLANLTDTEINQTYQSLIRLLLNLDPKVIMEIANSIWYRDTFSVLADFIETNRTYFDAAIMPRNFNDPATIMAINSWVSSKTHGKIDNVIASIDPTTIMFLINAIYFKGTWQYEFEKDKTSAAPFYLLDGSTGTCQMMQMEKDLLYYSDQNVQIVDLPYGSGAFSMTIILPRDSHTLNSWIAQLDISQWQNYISQLDTQKVILEFPKFKLEYRLLMNDVLKTMGMAVAFDPNMADFSRINNDIQLNISEVIHKTFVQVDEEGTEAAAVTVVVVGYTSIGPDKNVYMRVDHPFMFVLRERKSGTILFIGKILQPKWSE